MKKKVSLKDIAEQVGVSTALVSYVLNNKEKEKRVGGEMAATIRKTAQELKYQPNQIAKSLKMGKTFTIGLIVANISNPFFGTLARIIEDEAKKHQYTVIFGSSDENHEKSWDLINVLMNRQVDGFIIAPSDHSADQIRYLQEQHIPVVLLDRYFPELQTNTVALDNFQASYEAVRHLLQQGHTRVGMVTFRNDLFHLKERARGYRAALQEQQIPVQECWLREVEEANVQEEVSRLVEEWVHTPEPPEALFFSTNTLAIQGLKAIHQRKLSVPKDLAVVCFDETDVYDFFYCPVTYVKQPMAGLGKAAVQLLVKSMQGAAAPLHLSLPSELVLGESSRR